MVPFLELRIDNKVLRVLKEYLDWAQQSAARFICWFCGTQWPPNFPLPVGFTYTQSRAVIILRVLIGSSNFPSSLSEYIWTLSPISLNRTWNDQLDSGTNMLVLRPISPHNNDLTFKHLILRISMNLPPFKIRIGLKHIILMHISISFQLPSNCTLSSLLWATSHQPTLQHNIFASLFSRAQVIPYH